MFKKLKPYIISIVIALAVGGLSALVTSGNMDIYSRIIKPPLAPPAILFPIVWTILYILMGVSAAIVCKDASASPGQKKSALKVYAISLFVNFLWSPLFFNLQAFFVSFLWLVLLWVLIVITIARYAKISPLAAYLQIPYLVWVTFAGYLNLAIYILN